MYLERLKSLLRRWKESAKKLKTETLALYLAYKRPDVPWYAKLFIIVVVGYALSPVDLIPDFIPVLGYLDDLVLIPLGIKLAINMIPGEVMTECRQEAKEAFSGNRPESRAAGIVIILLWIAVILFIVFKYIV